MEASGLSYIAIAGAACLAWFALHLAWWRIALPQRQATALVCCFLLSQVAFLGCLWWTKAAAAEFIDISASGVIYILLINGGVFCAYLISFPALEQDSPSSLILLAIEAAGDKGATREDLGGVITDKIFVLDRLQGLLAGRMLQDEGGKLAITRRGRSYRDFFLFFRKISNRHAAGG